MGWFLPLSMVAVAITFGVAWVARSRQYATFRAVMLTIYTLIAAGVASAFDAAEPVFLYLHSTVYVQSVVLARPRMMPLAYRILVSMPASWFAAGTLLAWPWAILRGVGFDAWGTWLPYAVALLGLVQSLTSRAEELDLVVGDGEQVEGEQRHPTGGRRAERPVAIAQITDPHLGPFMSAARLRRIAARIVDKRPDLVMLTGDFLTMESQSDPAVLAHGLEPLQALRGRVYACFGNHDHEAPDTVRDALERIGARLLVDESEVVETGGGTVQIVGVDFRWRGRRAHIREVLAAHPRVEGALRVVLLHDPSAFKHVPEGDAELVLSGHTHGGQVGLVSLGLSWTMLRVFVKSPDHGFWANGTNRLYVHRGTGHYGFPLRVGVPAEESVLRVHRMNAS